MKSGLANPRALQFIGDYGIGAGASIIEGEK